MAKLEDLEVWQNSGHSTVGVLKFDVLGNRIHEMVTGGRKIHISPLERRMNQEICADDSLDPFKNGRLVPVRLVDSEENAEDVKAIQANPNAMSETAMKDLFKANAPTFAKKVKEVSNPDALSRMLEIASEVDASIRQVEVIQGRLDEVTPKLGEHAKIAGTAAIGTSAPRPEGRQPKGVTPK